MQRKIGCLHAHHSNIGYIQNAMAASDWELVHFVDPGLMNRMASDDKFDLSKAQNKVVEQIEWIAKTNVDAIFITCTNYIALLEEVRIERSIRILKIDEPLFHYICSLSEPQILLFTNPATVEGTMKRLNEFASRCGKPVSNMEVHVVEDTFELIMQGKKERYLEEVSNYIRNLIISDNKKAISVAQLSMVDSAEIIECEMDVQIGHPVKPLAAYLDSKLLG